MHRSSCSTAVPLLQYKLEGFSSFSLLAGCSTRHTNACYPKKQTIGAEKGGSSLTEFKALTDLAWNKKCNLRRRIHVRYRIASMQFVFPRAPLWRFKVVLLQCSIPSCLIYDRQECSSQLVRFSDTPQLRLLRISRTVFVTCPLSFPRTFLYPISANTRQATLLEVNST